MSEEWFWRSAVYLKAKGRNQRKPREYDSSDFPTASRVDENGAWILTE